MLCHNCGSQLAEDAAFCHKCRTPPVDLDEKTIKSEHVSVQKIENIAMYDIVLVEITSNEDLSEKAHMAVAYVLFEDEIKRISSGSEPDSDMKQQVQEEATENAYIMAKNLPATLKRSVKKKEALFFKERLAGYGVTVLLGYCPHCGGSLNKMSDTCSECGQAAIELSDDNDAIVDIIDNQEAATELSDDREENIVDSEKPMLGETSSFCVDCGTLSQGEAEFCRKCGSQTGDAPAFSPAAAASVTPAAAASVTPGQPKKILPLILAIISLTTAISITIFFLTSQL